MSAREVVERICRLPVDFYGGSKSMSQLVAETGISACLALLTVGNIREYLTVHPDLIEQWLLWSANKRVTSGWYFSRDAHNFVVGFYPEGEVLILCDPAAACAEFVVREVNALARPRRKN
jgi:hypothetical protein